MFIVYLGQQCRSEKNLLFFGLVYVFCVRGWGYFLLAKKKVSPSPPDMSVETNKKRMEKIILLLGYREKKKESERE
jgi:hypothetical protein